MSFNVEIPGEYTGKVIVSILRLEWVQDGSGSIVIFYSWITQQYTVYGRLLWKYLGLCYIGHVSVLL